MMKHVWALKCCCTLYTCHLSGIVNDQNTGLLILLQDILQVIMEEIVIFVPPKTWNSRDGMI